MALSWTEANAAVTEPGQIFELIDAEVMGVKTQIFKNAPPHLGLVFAGARGHGDKTFLVYEGETWSFAKTNPRCGGAFLKICVLTPITSASINSKICPGAVTAAFASVQLSAT